jgi:Protein of unknown function (DUF3093)
MRVYRERLGVPVSWWLSGAGCVFMFGTLVWAGFTVAIGIYVYLSLAVLVTFALLRWGATTITVTSTELVVGSQRLAVDQMSEVVALDGTQTTALRGPRADPAAYLLARPYLPESVYVGVAGRPADRPYWLIGTRHGAALVAAIEKARSRSGLTATCND